jgi:hypothetical protein
MAETQPVAYVICRRADYTALNVPVKVFNTRDAARSYAKRLNARAKRYTYTVHRVKQG